MRSLPPTRQIASFTIRSVLPVPAPANTKTLCKIESSYEVGRVGDCVLAVEDSHGRIHLFLAVAGLTAEPVAEVLGLSRQVGLLLVFVVGLWRQNQLCEGIQANNGFVVLCNERWLEGV